MRSPPRLPRSVVLTAIAIALCLPACRHSPGAGAAPAGANDASAAAAVSPGAGACRLLSRSEVREALPGVGDGRPVESATAYGMQACEWSGDEGRFTAQVAATGTETDEHAIRGLMDGVIDPMRRDAARRLRVERLAGVGDGAYAVLERRDESQGILADIAIVVAHRGDRRITLMSDSLSNGERAATLAALATLGKRAVERL